MVTGGVVAGPGEEDRKDISITLHLSPLRTHKNTCDSEEILVPALVTNRD